MEEILRGTLEVVVYISVHGTHIVNNFHSLLPEVPDEKVSIIFRVLQNQNWVFECFSIPPLLTRRMSPHVLHVTTSVDERFAMRIQVTEGLTGQVGHPIT